MTYGLLALLGVYILSRRCYTIYNDGQKYLTRYYFFGKWFRRVFNRNLFIHHFHASDSREYHSHRWLFGYSLILWGGYTEWRRQSSTPTLSVPGMSPHAWWHTTVKTHRLFSINKLDSTCFHRTDMLNEERGTYSLFYAGPFAADDWGFLREDGTTEYARDRFLGQRDALSDD